MRLLLPFLLALSCCGQTVLQSGAFSSWTVGAAASAATWVTNSSFVGYVNLGDYDTNCWRALKFTNSAATKLDAVNLYIIKGGSPTATLESYLYSDSGTAPNTLVATGGTIASSALGTVGALTNILTLSATITPSTAYWVVLHLPSTNAVAYVKVAVGDAVTPYTAHAADVTGPWVVTTARTGHFAYQVQ